MSEDATGKLRVWCAIARKLGMKPTKVVDGLSVEFKYNVRTRHRTIPWNSLTKAWGDYSRTKEIICNARSAIIKELS